MLGVLDAALVVAECGRAVSERTRGLVLSREMAMARVNAIVVWYRRVLD